jgi:hypothetical protein
LPSLMQLFFSWFLWPSCLILLGHPQATHLLEGTSIALLRLFPVWIVINTSYFAPVFVASLCCWGWATRS